MEAYSSSAGIAKDLPTQTDAAPVTSSLAIMLIPCLAKGGGFLDFLPVPFSNLCSNAAKVTSSIAECTLC